MFVDSTAFREQGVARDQGGDRGEERQQAVKYDAGGHGEKPVVVHLLIGPKQDILPSLPRDLPRRNSVPPPSTFFADLVLGTRSACRGGGPRGFSREFKYLTLGMRASLWGVVLQCAEPVPVPRARTLRLRPDRASSGKGSETALTPADRLGQRVRVSTSNSWNAGHDLGANP